MAPIRSFLARTASALLLTTALLLLTSGVAAAAAGGGESNDLPTGAIVGLVVSAIGSIALLLVSAPHLLRPAAHDDHGHDSHAGHSDDHE